MIANEVGQRLHDRATRGETLSAEELASLEGWYALQDAEEIALLANAPNPENVEALRKRVGEVINRIQAMTERTQTLLAENEKLSQEVSALRQQRFGGEEADVRQAYPLMDAVARSEGWDDPEMDSYNVYARKPQP